MLTEFLKKIYRSLPLVRELRQIDRSLQGIKDATLLGATVDAVRFLDFEIKTHPRYSSAKRLTAFEFGVNSQNGEDGIIQEIFKRTGITNRHFVEIGLGDGTECNTGFLLPQGWTGCWIDGSATFLQATRINPGITATNLKTLVAFINRENIESSFNQLGVPKEFDLLSLDIDQNTYYAWEGINAFRPRVIVVEYNSALPPNIEWKAAYSPDRVWSGTHNNYSASLKSLELLGRSRGYSLVGCDFNGVNAFFVRNDLIADKFEAPFTAENHYEPPRLALSLFQRAHRKSILDVP